MPVAQLAPKYAPDDQGIAVEVKTDSKCVTSTSTQVGVGLFHIGLLGPNTGCPREHIDRPGRIADIVYLLGIDPAAAAFIKDGTARVSPSSARVEPNCSPFTGEWLEALR
jgi:hypothetical protein